MPGKARNEAEPRPQEEKDDKGWQKKQKRKVCIFCKDQIDYVDYKDTVIAAQVRLGARQDPRAPRDGQLRRSISATSPPRSRTPARWPCCRTRRDEGHPPEARRQARRARATSSRSPTATRATTWFRAGWRSRPTKGGVKHADSLKRAHDSRVERRRRSRPRRSPPERRRADQGRGPRRRGGQALRLRHRRRHRRGDRGRRPGSTSTATTCTSRSRSGRSARTRCACTCSRRSTRSSRSRSKARPRPKATSRPGLTARGAVLRARFGAWRRGGARRSGIRRAARSAFASDPSLETASRASAPLDDARRTTLPARRRHTPALLPPSGANERDSPAGQGRSGDRLPD